ncbi:MAG: isoleucine--tRNA ligase [Ardenticatenaceae bacterium]|nr:isoleucine--tRNA ligase [Ardenticatenaceae bacterium]MCB8987925.1 isoleucine--tRNA ligase [Ardenticatenaceae bacterium]
MGFKDVSNKVDFVQLEYEILDYWQKTDAFNELRRLRAATEKEHGIFSFIDGPITANNPMGVHHAWGRTYKDLYQRYYAMQGKNERWQNGFDCQGLWVEVNVEKRLGFNSKREIEKFGLARFTNECKHQVLNYAAVQTEQSIRLGYWMDWNDTAVLRQLRDMLVADPYQQVTVQGPYGPVTGTVEQVVGQLGMPQMGGSYFTFSDENNYQIWAFLRKCFDRGWVYKGRDVMPWCARCGTGISQHEIVTEGYQEVTHDSVFVRFPITAKPQGSSETLAVPDKEALLVWTTTPWTLTSNVAAAVGPELTYVKAQADDGWTYYLAEEAMKQSLIGQAEVIERLKGEDMLGWQYSGPFDELPAAQAAFAEKPDADGSPYTHRVIPWKEVGADEGTGIVHIAPGCGAEDFELGKEFDLPIIAPLDENGIYKAGFDWLTGQSAHDVAPAIFENLHEKGLYYRKQRYAHRYPHCWRCGSELVYRLVDEWFINMGDLYDKPYDEVTPAEKAASFRYQIMDSVNQANWYPSFGHDREMDWLRNMHDWMISKKRYYGLALPIYECEECGHFHVVGSREELEERAVEGWEEFDGHTPHRPFIDQVKIACPNCGSPVSRIQDVGNPWLDAGIVGISTLHYSVDRAYWEKWYPADWISESFPGQFRNWFYSLLAQSTLMADGVGPFKNLFGYATLQAEDGRDMHKSWGNMIEFNEAADQMGADTMRWLYASCKPEQNLRFGYHVGDETRRRFLIPLWNVYSFFVSYAQLDNWQPQNGGWTSQSGQSPNAANAQMDKWIVERLAETTLLVRTALDVYDSEKATQQLEAFLDDLSNWYVRRSRRRFWKSEADADKAAAYTTLHHVLVEYVKLLAPFIPFVTEAMYQNLVRTVDENAPASVHHCFYPQAEAATLDHALLAKMRLAIVTAGLGRAARGAADVKLRQPLARARVNVGSQQEQADLAELADVLQEEINVKEIEIVSEVGELVDYKLLPNNRVLGPKFGKDFPRVRRALEALDPAQAARRLQAGQNLALDLGDKTVELTNEDVLVQTEARGGLAVASDKGVTVAVDTELTPELVQEGYARDLVRAINNMRKDAGLEISDRIELSYAANGDVAAALENFADYVQQETLAVLLTAVPLANPVFQQTVNVGGQDVELALRKTAV